MMSHSTSTNTSSYGTVGFSNIADTNSQNSNSNNNNNNDSSNRSNHTVSIDCHSNNNHDNTNSSVDHVSFPTTADESSLITVIHATSNETDSRTHSYISHGTSTFISSHIEPKQELHKVVKKVKIAHVNNNSSEDNDDNANKNENESLNPVAFPHQHNDDGDSTYINDTFDFESDEHKPSFSSSVRGMFELLRPLKIWLLLLLVAFATIYVLLHFHKEIFVNVDKQSRTRISIYLQWGLCVISLLMLAPVQVWATEMFEDYALTTFNEHVAAGDEKESSFTLFSFGNILCAHSPLLIFIFMLLVMSSVVMVWEVKLIVTGVLFLHLLCLLGSGLAKLRLPLLSAFSCFRAQYGDEEENSPREEEEEEIEEVEEESQLRNDTCNEEAHLLRKQKGSATEQEEEYASSSQSPRCHSPHNHHHHHRHRPHHHNHDHTSECMSRPHENSRSISSGSHACSSYSSCANQESEKQQQQHILHHHHNHNHHHHHSPTSLPQSMYYKITHYLSSSPFLFYEYYSPHRFNKGHGVLLLSATIVFLIPSAYKFVYLSDRIPESTLMTSNSSITSLLSSAPLERISTFIPAGKEKFNNFNAINDEVNTNNESAQGNFSVMRAMTYVTATMPEYTYNSSQLQMRLLYLSRALSICLLIVYGIYVAERCNVFKRASTLYNIITIVEVDHDGNRRSYNNSINNINSNNTKAFHHAKDKDNVSSESSSGMVANQSVSAYQGEGKRRYRRLNIPPFCGPFLLSMSVVARVCRQCDKFRSRGCDEVAQQYHCRPSSRNAISHTYYSKQFMLFWLVMLLLLQVVLCYVVFQFVLTLTQNHIFTSSSSLVYFVLLPVLLEGGHWLAIFMTTSITNNNNCNNIENNMIYNIESNAGVTDNQNSSVSNINMPVVSRNANYEAMLLRNAIDNTLDVMLLIYPLCVISAWVLGANMNLTIHQFMALITVFVALIICELNWLVQNKYRGPNIPVNNYRDNEWKSKRWMWNENDKDSHLIAVSPRENAHSRHMNNNNNNNNIIITCPNTNVNKHYVKGNNTNVGKGLRRSCSHTCLDEAHNVAAADSNNGTNTVFRFHGFVLLIMYVVIVVISYTHDKYSYY